MAPSRIPQRSGERIKNDTCDALMLARLLRAGELSFIWIDLYLAHIEKRTARKWL